MCFSLKDLTFGDNEKILMVVEFASAKKFILTLNSEFVICVWLGSHPVKISLRALVKADT